MKRPISRAALACAITAAVFALSPSLASAHVTVSSPSAARGGHATLSFQVPNESATSSPTIKLTVTMPNFKEALTMPKAGWVAVETKNQNDEITSITWTATPGAPGIAVGQFDQFLVSVAPLPDATDVTFPAVQTYSDGEVVNWNEPNKPDGSEPEHPAPDLKLTSSDGSMSTPHSDHGASVSASPDSNPSATASGKTADSDNAARWLGGIGLLLGAIGIAIGVVSLRKR